MPDIIIALFKDGSGAENARTDLVREGFATDRVDVTSRASPGVAAHAPVDGSGTTFRPFFKSLLTGSALAADADMFAQRLDAGDTALVLHPRGLVELNDADEVLARHHADLVKRDVKQSLSPTPVVGEHAAGKP